jgi:hypothetical protein
MFDIFNFHGSPFYLGSNKKSSAATVQGPRISAERAWKQGKLHISAIFSNISAFMIFNIFSHISATKNEFFPYLRVIFPDLRAMIFWHFPISPRYFPISYIYFEILHIFPYLRAFFNFPISPKLLNMIFCSVIIVKVSCLETVFCVDKKGCIAGFL